MRVVPADREVPTGGRRLLDGAPPVSAASTPDPVPAAESARGRDALVAVASTEEAARESPTRRLPRAAAVVGARRRGIEDARKDADAAAPEADDARHTGELAESASDAPRRVRRVIWQPTEWPVLVRVVAVLAIPALVAAVFGFTQVQTQLSAAAADARAAQQSAALLPAWDMIVATDALVMGGPDDEAAAAQYDDAVARLTASRENADLTEQQTDAVDAVIAIGTDVRLRASQYAAPQVTRLGHSVADLIAGVDATGARAGHGLDVLRELVSARIALTEQRVLVTFPSSRGEADRSALAAAIGAESAALGRIEDPADDARQAISAASTGSTQRLILVRDAQAIDPASMQSAVNSYGDAAHATVASITQAAQADAAAARTTALWSTALVLALLVAALVFALVIARSLTRPLAEVRRSTQDIADRRLPEDVAEVLAGERLERADPIAVTSSEEIGQLARAVESMYDRARSLAGAQADLQRQVSGMFETLSRRSNALVDRQLQIMEHLERDEDDPGRLEKLFELDHLAARMRRNGDSLLVLAGAKGRPPRVAEVAVEDAVRAASAEVRDYRRVVVGGFGGVRVVAAASTDLIHLFAELIDNALAYSPPGTDVHALGARTADGGMLVEIVDEGLGIAEAERTRLNELLRESASVSAEAARRMGLHVVARLASTHGIVVSLRPGAEGGTIASVAVPAALLAVGSRPAADTPDTDAVSRHDRRPPAVTTSRVPVSAPSSPASAPRTATATTRPPSGSRPTLPQRGRSNPVETAAVAAPSTERAGAPRAAGDRPPLARRVRGENGFPASEEPDTATAPLAAPVSAADGLDAAARQPFAGFLSRSAAAERLASERRADDVDGSSSTQVMQPLAPRDPISAPATVQEEDDDGSDDEFIRDWEHVVRHDAPVAARADATTKPVDTQRAPSGSAAEPAVVTAPRPIAAEGLGSIGTAKAPSAGGTPARAVTVDPAVVAAARAAFASVPPAAVAASAETTRSATVPGASRTATSALASTPAAAPPPAAATARASAAPSVPSSLATPTPPVARATAPRATPVAPTPVRAAVDRGAPAAGTPIYDALSSAWLSEDAGDGQEWGSEAVERARRAAARVAETTVTETTAGGLPRRTPGAHLSPGGTELLTRRQARRDPQELRASLNRHLSAVRRGRRDARENTTDTPDDE